MREVLRTNDLVLLSFAMHVLNEEGIESLVFDAHMSAVEGSVGVLPRRLMVSEADLQRARHALGNASITVTAHS